MIASFLPLLAAASGDIGPLGRALVLVAVLGTAVALFLLIVLLLGTRSIASADLESRLSPYSGTKAPTTMLSRVRLLRRFAARAERIAERRGVLSQIETALEQANIHVRAGEAIAGALLLAIIVFVLGLVITGDPIWGLLAGVVAMVVAWMAVAGVASRQRRRFEQQLPDTLNLLATSLRAGYSMLQALDAATQESPEPTSREFRRVLNEIRLGRSVGEALQDSAGRMESEDFDWVVLAFTIQREVGGNLAEVLQTTAETILARGRLRSEVKALTTEGRISAVVLGLLPFALFGLLWFVNPGYLDPLLNTTLGNALMVGAVLLLLLGLWWINQIVKIEV